MNDRDRKAPQTSLRAAILDTQFAGADGKLWAYDHQTGGTSELSSKQLMQILNLYTVQPSGADDTTLETVDLNRTDSQGSATFDRVLNGDHSQSPGKNSLRFSPPRSGTIRMS